MRRRCNGAKHSTEAQDGRQTMVGERRRSIEGRAEARLEGRRVRMTE